MGSEHSLIITFTRRAQSGVMTQPLPPLDGHDALSPHPAPAGPARGGRVLAVTVAALVVLGAGAGVGMAVTADAADAGGSSMTGPGMTGPAMTGPGMTGSGSASRTPTAGTATGKPKAGTGHIRQGVPERQAWSHR